MSQHTQGKICYAYEPGYCGELVSSDGYVIATFTDEPARPDADRLVACWNIAVGTPTQGLQELAATSDTPLASLSRLAREVKAQRDQLLTALKTARDRIGSLNESFVETVISPATGLIENPEDLLIAEADQDFLNSLDRVIASAEKEAQP